jgi:hypothetical protein
MVINSIILSMFITAIQGHCHWRFLSRGIVLRLDDSVGAVMTWNSITSNFHVKSELCKILGPITHDVTISIEMRLRK